MDMSTAHILIIEDDDLVARTVERSLSDDQFQISLADNGQEGIQLARKNSPDLVILDVIMPEMDGYEVCRRMRSDAQLADIPILFLTAKIKDEDRVNGFLAGADDYLTKPFNIDELTLRVRAILRRTRQNSHPEHPTPGVTLFTPHAQQVLQDLQKQKTGAVAASTLVVGDYVLDTQTYELHTPTHGQVRLTPIQYDLVYHLMNNAGQLFSPNRLLDEVWDYPVDTGSPDLVRVHIKNLRERIEKDPRAPEFIRTVPGYGYMVEAQLSMQE
jgi:two-component system response regulator RpaA